MTRVLFRDDVAEHGANNGETSSATQHRGSDISDDGEMLASMQDFHKQKMRRRQSVSAESKMIRGGRGYCFIFALAGPEVR